MTRCAKWLVPLVCLLATPAGVRADDVLDIIPDDALAVVLIHEPTTLSEKVQSLATKIGMEAPHAMVMLKTFSGVRAGLDDNATMALVLMPPTSTRNQPKPLVFVPVTDYKAFIGQLQPDDGDAEISEVQVFGKPAIVTHLDDYAVFAEPRQEELLEEIADADPLGDSIADSLAWIDEQDVVLLATADGIEWGLSTARNGLAVAKAQMQRNPPPGAEAALTYFDMMEKLFVGLEENVTCLAKGVQISDKGVVVSLYAGVDPDSDWAAGDSSDDGPDALDDLPAGPFVAAIAFNGTPEWATKMSALGFEVMKASPPSEGGRPMTDEDVQRMIKANATMYQQFQSVSMVMRPSKDGEGLFSNSFGYINVDDSAQYMKDYEAAVADLKTIADEVKNPMLPAYTYEQIDVNGTQTLKVSVQLPKAGDEQPADVGAAQAKVMEMMFGNNGSMDAYIAAVSPTKVLISYDRNLFAERIAKGEPSQKLVDDPATTKTFDLLDTCTRFVALVDGEGVVQTTGMLMKNVLQQLGNDAGQGKELKLPAFGAAPPLGIGSGPAAGGAELRIALPVELLATIVQYVPKVGEAVQGVGMQQMNAPMPQPAPVAPAVPVP